MKQGGVGSGDWRWVGHRVDHLVNFRNTELEPKLDWLCLNLALFLRDKSRWGQFSRTVIWHMLSTDWLVEDIKSQGTVWFFWYCSLPSVVQGTFSGGRKAATKMISIIIYNSNTLPILESDWKKKERASTKQSQRETNILHHLLHKCRAWELNPGPCACNKSTLPLSSIAGNDVAEWYGIRHQLWTEDREEWWVSCPATLCLLPWDSSLTKHGVRLEVSEPRNPPDSTPALG